MTNGNKVIISKNFQAAIKQGVSKVEKNGFELVYPNSLNNGNSLLKGSRVKKNPTDGFNIHMKILTPLDRIEGWHKLEYTKSAIQMLDKQFERLHSKRPHTDFNVKYVKGAAPPKDEYKKYTSLVRQILVEQNNDGKVVRMYLTDFDIQKTNEKNNNRKNLEKKVVEQFKDFIENKNERSSKGPSRGSATRQLMFNSPGKRGRNNTPQRGSVKKLAF
jgi:hypothetical protein